MVKAIGITAFMTEAPRKKGMASESIRALSLNCG